MVVLTQADRVFLQVGLFTVTTFHSFVVIKLDHCVGVGIGYAVVGVQGVRQGA